MTRSNHGFVLINALILIAALASVATLLLTVADAGRQRLTQSRLATQLELNLDAFEAFAITTLIESADSELPPRQQNLPHEVPLARFRVGTDPRPAGAFQHQLADVTVIQRVPRSPGSPAAKIGSVGSG
jgi:hypothetical protein